MLHSSSFEGIKLGLHLLLLFANRYSVLDFFIGHVGDVRRSKTVLGKENGKQGVEKELGVLTESVKIQQHALPLTNQAKTDPLRSCPSKSTHKLERVTSQARFRSTVKV